MSEENKDVKDVTSAAPETTADAAKEATDAIKEEAQAGADVQADLNAAAAAEEASRVKAAAIDEMEKASQKALDAMREENNTANDEIVGDASEKLDEIFESFRKWIADNTQPERVKAELETVRTQTAKVLNDTRDKVTEVAESEQFKNTMTAGKDFLTGTGTMIGDGFKYGYDKLMEIPEFKKAAGKVDEGIDKLRQSEFLKNVVDNTEKGLNDLNNAVFSGLRSFFENKAESAPVKPEGMPDVPKEDKTGE